MGSYVVLSLFAGCRARLNLGTVPRFLAVRKQLMAMKVMESNLAKSRFALLFETSTPKQHLKMHDTKHAYVLSSAPQQLAVAQITVK